MNRLLEVAFFVAVFGAIPFAANSETCDFWECDRGVGPGTIDEDFNAALAMGVKHLKDEEYEAAVEHFEKAMNKSTIGKMPNIFIYHLPALAHSLSGNEERARHYLRMATFVSQLSNGVILCSDNGFIKISEPEAPRVVSAPDERLDHKRLCAAAHEGLWRRSGLEEIVSSAVIAERTMQVRECMKEGRPCNELWY